MKSETTRAPAFQDSLEYPPSLRLHNGGMLVWALDATGKLCYVDDVPNGKACGCFCPACKDALIARHGRILAHSFAHDSGAECRWAHEAILHHIAKHLIEQRGEFVAPPSHLVVRRDGPIRLISSEAKTDAVTIRPNSVALEHILFKHRPDIVLSIGDRRLLVEIAVRNKVTADKQALLKARGDAAVEIDLTRKRPETVGELAAILFGTDPRKQWLVNAKHDQQRNQLEQECEQAYQEQVRMRAERAAMQRAARPEPTSLPDVAHRPPPRQRTAVEQVVRGVASDAVRFKTSDGSLWIRFVTENEVLVVIDDGALGMLGELRLFGTVRADNAFQVARSTWERLQRRYGAVQIGG